MKKTFLLPILIILSACSSTVHLYEGEQLPDEKTTKISLTKSEDTVIEVVRIDGQKIYRRTAHLLPGKHVVTILFKDWYTNKDFSNKYPFVARVERALCTATLNSRAGESYLLSLNKDGAAFIKGSAQPKLSIQLEGSKSVVSKGTCVVRDPSLPVE